MTGWKLYAVLIVGCLAVGFVLPTVGGLMLLGLAGLTLYGRGVKAGYRQGFTEGGDAMVARLI